MPDLRNLWLSLCAIAIGSAGAAYGQGLSFKVAPLYPTGGSPVAVAVGDVNGDGKPDLAVVNTAYPTGNVSILLNNGSGGFQAAVNYPAATSPSAVALGDFNGDGKLDLAVTDRVANYVLIRLGNGDGSFEGPLPYAAGTAPTAVAAGDFNGDGKTDLAVADYGDYSGVGGGVSVLLGNGNGTFQSAVLLTTGNCAQSVTVGDFNGDNKLDVAVANDRPSNVSILLGNGNGSFQTAVNYGVGNGLSSVATGDFNRDGKADLAVTSPWGNDVWVLLGYGDGTFQAGQRFPLDSSVYGSSPPNSLAVGDWNADGKPDLVVASGNAEHVCVLLGNGDGTFPALKPYAAGAKPYAAAPADFDGDGKLDLAVANNSAGGVSLLRGNGDGSFQAAPLYRADIRPEAIVHADFNGDGKLDLAEVTSFYGHLVVLLGNGDGTFQAPAISNVAGRNSLAVGDFNGDGKPDLVTAGSDLVVWMHLGNGDGTFQGAVNIFAARFVAVGDFNADGKVDLAAINGNVVSILLGNGNGTFQAAVGYAAGSTPSFVAISDFNADGKADLVVANQGGMSVLLGNGDGTFQSALNVVASNVQSIVSADLNGDGAMDIATANYQGASVFLGNGNGTFQPAVSYLAGTNCKTVAVGDLNGDGKPDLAITAASRVSVLLGNGNGTMQAPVSFPVPGSSTPGIVAVGDFNRDGRPDLAAPTAESDTVAILLNTTTFPPPSLTVAKTHTGNFLRGQANAAYTVVVSNAAGAPTSGTITVTDILPAGMTLVSMAGDGWECTGNTCTRGDVLVAGGVYPAISVTVNVSSLAPAQLTNQVSVSGGGGAAAGAQDLTIIAGVPPSLSITKAHTGTFTQGQGGATYTVTVTNAASAGPTTGAVTVTETIPPGLSLAGMSGEGWSCVGNSCTRVGPLATGASYPAITVTVNVGASATSPQVNSVTVSGGGSSSADASDPTNINPRAIIELGADFNADGRPDIIWQDPISGWAQVWYLGGAQGVTTTGAANLTARNTWRIVGVADFNRDGHPDVVWQDPVTGAAQVWFLGGPGGNVITSAATISPGNTWRIMSIADFNGDGIPDCIWQDQASGWAQIWFMGGAQGTTVTGAVNLTTRNTWRIGGTGDFNGDGVPDVVWQDPITGATQIWRMGGAQGNVVQSAVTLVNSNAWKLAAIADFNGDGHPDVVWQDPATGASQVWFLGGAQGVTVSGSAAMGNSNTWRIMGPR